MPAADAPHYPPGKRKARRGNDRTVREQGHSRKFSGRKAIERPVGKVDALVKRDDTQRAQKPGDDSEDEQNRVLAERLSIEPRCYAVPGSFDGFEQSFEEPIKCGRARWIRHAQNVTEESCRAGGSGLGETDVTAIRRSGS